MYHANIRFHCCCMCHLLARGSSDLPSPPCPMPCCQRNNRKPQLDETLLSMLVPCHLQSPASPLCVPAAWAAETSGRLVRQGRHLPEHALSIITHWRGMAPPRQRAGSYCSVAAAAAEGSVMGGEPGKGVPGGSHTVPSPTSALLLLPLFYPSDSPSCTPLHPLEAPYPYTRGASYWPCHLPQPTLSPGLRCHLHILGAEPEQLKHWLCWQMWMGRWGGALLQCQVHAGQRSHHLLYTSHFAQPPSQPNHSQEPTGEGWILPNSIPSLAG